MYRSIVKGVSVFESNLIQYNTHLDLNSPTSTSHHDDIVYTRPTEATERELFWKPLMGIKGTNFVTEDNEYTSHKEDWSQWYKDSIRNTPSVGLQKMKDSVYFDDEKSNNKIDMKNRNDLPIIEPKKMTLNVKENNLRQMPHLGINNMIHKSPLLHKYKATPSKNVQRLVPRNQNKNSSDLQTNNPFASLKPIKRTMNNSFDTLGIPGHAERKEPLNKNYDEGDEGIDYINSIANSDYKPVIKRPVAGARRKRNDSDPIDYSLFNESQVGLSKISKDF